MKKTSKSPESTEVTPSKKKLKQIRLPFMLISDVSPKSDAPPSRKRKLSVPEAEPVTKLGKVSKENTVTDDSIVISDEDSKGVPSPQNQEKPQNPLVKLVDTAWKKKLQKAKGQKKQKRSSKRLTNGATQKQCTQDNNSSIECEDVEMVEVDVIIHEDSKKTNNQTPIKDSDVATVAKSESAEAETSKDKDKSSEQPQKVSPSSHNSPVKKSMSKTKKTPPKTSTNNKKITESSEIICLEDSVDSSDAKVEIKTTENQKQTEIETKKTDAPKQAEKLVKQVPKRSSRNKTIQEVIKPVNEPQKTNENIKEEPKEVPMDTSQTSVEHSQETDSKPEPSEALATPKRITRTKKLDESILDSSTASSKLDESIVSSPSTPKQNKSIIDGNADKTANESIKSANLTPKQLQKKMESAKKREEREKEKQERELKRQQEKEERAKQRQEKEEQKKREREEKEEAKKREKEEKEEQRKKEKEEKEKQREMEKKVRELKEEQKKKEKEDKEEQRKKEKEAREEERRRKQEALELEKQEQELKKKKAAEAFVNFFVPKQKTEKESYVGPVSKSSMLSSFTVKSDMRLAPTCRSELTAERKEMLDECLEDQAKAEKLYLTCLKDGSIKPMTSSKTWPLDDRDDDVMIVEDELPLPSGEAQCAAAPRLRLRAKLLAFSGSRRPPYWGTWRRASRRVGPRRPFGQDHEQLDYEVDSDDDWEDEADGESLDGSAGGSDDEAGADDYEVDNEVFVPHGYLSDEEATMDEEDRDDVLSLSPETQKARLKHLEDEFESEMKKPTEKLKPRLYGLLWETDDGGKPEKCVDALWNYFEKFAMIMNDPTPLLQPLPEPEIVAEKKKAKKKKLPEETPEQSPKSEKKKKLKTENKEPKKPKVEVKKAVPNQLSINNFLKKVNDT